VGEGVSEGDGPIQPDFHNNNNERSGGYLSPVVWQKRAAARLRRSNTHADLEADAAAASEVTGR
jgi:hypothetical protein